MIRDATDGFSAKSNSAEDAMNQTKTVYVACAINTEKNATVIPVINSQYI